MDETPPTTGTHTPARRFQRLVMQRGFSPLRWLLGLVLALLLLLAISIAVITHWDWNSARPWVAGKVSEATGRSFSIDGDLSAQWHWPLPLEHGWKRWVPGVTVQAENIRLGNPQGFAIQVEPHPGSASQPSVPDKRSAATRSTSVALPADAAHEPVHRPSAPAHAEPAGKPAEDDDGMQGDAERSEQADAQDARRLIAQARNAPEMDAPARSPQTMATVARATATLRLLPLLNRTIALDTVMLTAPDIVLGRHRDGTNNWTFKGSSDAGPTPWHMSLGQLIVQGGWLGYSDGVKDMALRARVNTFAADDSGDDDDGNRYGVHVILQGRYGKARVEGEGLAGPILSLRRKTVSYPIRFKARAGSLHAQAEGVLANPRDLSGMDLQVSLRGASMADLYALTGLVLPSTPAFETRGRLLGSLAPGKAVWEYRDFDGQVGASDLHGSLTYTSAEPRPRLEGRMLSKKLRLADLGPVVGNSSAQEKALRNKGRVLPDTPFETGRWGAMDLDIAFTAEQIIRPSRLPIENLSTRAVLKDAVLTLAPLRFGVAKGKIQADVTLDSREKPLKATLRGSADGLQLSALFPDAELMKKSLGRLDGAFSLATRGNSVATMLGNSSGETKLFIRDGTFSKQLLDLAALNLGSVIVTKLFGENKEVRLRCAVADWAIHDGVANARLAKMSTEEAIVEASGTIDLKNEKLDMRIKPESLKWKFFSLRTPLYVRGTFADPQVGVESGPLLLRAGVAVAAAVAAPVALALVPVTVPAAQDDANCKALLAQVK